MQFTPPNVRSLRTERGFTLIELMTTMTIISILSAIASHQFHSYSARALSARAENDLHSAITAEEAYYAEHEEYAACSGGDCDTVLPAYLLSLDTQIDITLRDDNQVFDAEAFHPSGDKTFSYSSETGEFSYVFR